MKKKSYAEENANKNLKRALPILFILTLFALFIGLYIQLMFNFRDSLLLLSGIIIGVSFYYIVEKVLLNRFLPPWGKYKGFIQGAAGEIEVDKALKQNFKEADLILADVKLRNYKGNIDHIVIGRHGFFVIETKTHKGNIICDGDTWFQEKKRGEKTELIKINYSPSKQAKNNAIRIKTFLNEVYPELPIKWIYAILVFPHKKSEGNIVHVINPPQECEVFTSINDMVERIKKGKVTYEITSDDLSQLEDIFNREQQNKK
jgi:hypothetical protein